jgi:hypothetical protein
VSLGIHLTLLIGTTLPVPAPATLINSLLSVEVTNTDKGRDGFQITFAAGRSGPTDILDYSLLNSPVLKPFNRVIILVSWGLAPKVLIDGIITHQQLNPSQEPGKSTLTVTGEDVSLMMDIEEKIQTYPNIPDNIIVSTIISSYATYGLIPNVHLPLSFDVPLMVDWIPTYQGTDLSYIQHLAQKNAYVFYVEPTDVPGVNNANWGPLFNSPVLSPQFPSLSVNMGANTNVESINFHYNSLGPQFVGGSVQDRLTNTITPVQQTSTSLRPPLSKNPSWLMANVRKRKLDSSGLDGLEAYASAQSKTDSSVDAVTVTGELDAAAYGDILRARNLVGLRGTGDSYDGIYYINNVTHRIKLGEYKQSFTLSRDGLGSTTPVVPP